MNTKNKKLRSKAKNRKYYSKSDGEFMPLQHSTQAHKLLDRVAWVREHVHKLGSEYHFDVGCKDGYLCLTLASEGINCLGIDPSEDAIEEAKLKKKELKLDDVGFSVGFIEDFEFDNMHFDTLSMLEVLEHIVSPHIVLEKVVKLSQFLLISTPDYHGRHGWEDAKNNEEHLRVYKKAELEKFLSKYGKIHESVVRDDQICVLLET
jgi:2-polyprenyl-3-methyl-5-hydroxy-6-metoxy-1,4-benzoquinol methylase